MSNRPCILALVVLLMVGATAGGGGGCRSSAKSDIIVADGKRDTERARKEHEHAFELIRDHKYDEAERACKRALQADIMFGPAHNNLGLVYYYQNKWYAAAWEFQNAVKLMPYQPEPRNNLGLVFERAGKIESAAEAYGKAHEIQPDNPEFLGNLARASVRMGQHDVETRSLLEEVVMKDDRPEWRDWATLTLLRMKDGTPASTAPSPQR
jgi:tetratricopeptide (TPR) repeat protein